MYGILIAASSEDESCFDAGNSQDNMYERKSL